MSAACAGASSIVSRACVTAASGSTPTCCAIWRWVKRPSQIASSLTSREAEIARLVSRGLRNKEIARELHLSEGTVKVHLHHIYEKLRKTQLALWMAGAWRADVGLSGNGARPAGESARWVSPQEPLRTNNAKADFTKTLKVEAVSSQSPSTRSTTHATHSAAPLSPAQSEDDHALQTAKELVPLSLWASPSLLIEDIKFGSRLTLSQCGSLWRRTKLQQQRNSDGPAPLTGGLLARYCARSGHRERQLRSAAEAKFLVDMMQMHLHGAFAQMELAGDFLVAHTSRYKAGDFSFA